MAKINNVYALRTLFEFLAEKTHFHPSVGYTVSEYPNGDKAMFFYAPNGNEVIAKLACKGRDFEVEIMGHFVGD